MLSPTPEGPVPMYVCACMYTHRHELNMNKHICLKFKAKKEKSTHHEYRRSDFLTKTKAKKNLSFLMAVH